MKHFNLVTDNWIPVKHVDSKTPPNLVSLVEVFENSSYYLLNSNPTFNLAILRLLIAITQTVSKSNPPDLDVKLIINYLNQPPIFKRFFLTGTDIPFLQCNVSDKFDFDSDISKMFLLEDSFNSCSNRNIKHQYPAHEVALNLLYFQNFAPGILGRYAKGYGLCSLNSQIHVLIPGNNIKEYILYNLLTQPFINEYPNGLGKPIWEIDPTNKLELKLLNTSYLGHLVPFVRPMLLNNELSLFSYKTESYYSNYEDSGVREPTTILSNNADGIKPVKIPNNTILESLHPGMLHNNTLNSLNIQSFVSTHSENLLPLEFYGLQTQNANILYEFFSSFSFRSEFLTQEALTIYHSGMEYTKSFKKLFFGLIKKYYSLIGIVPKLTTPLSNILINKFNNSVYSQLDKLIHISTSNKTFDFTKPKNEWSNILMNVASDTLNYIDITNSHQQITFITTFKPYLINYDPVQSKKRKETKK